MCAVSRMEIHLGRSQPLPLSPFLSIYKRHIPGRGAMALALQTATPLISAGPLVYFKHGRPQLSASHPSLCQVLAAAR